MKVNLLGQLCKDEILIKGSKEHKKLVGGGVFYSALALKSLGVEPIVYTKLDPVDHNLLSPFKKYKITFYLWKSSNTTFFRNVYDEFQNRSQTLLSDADPVNIQEIKSIPSLNSSIILAMPLTPSFLPLSILQYLSEKNVLYMNLQGYLRTTFKQTVKLSRPQQITRILKCCRMVSLNRSEAECLMISKNLTKTAEWIFQQGPEEVIITDGVREGLYYSDEGFLSYTIPKRHVHLKDPTGAGDIFTACYVFSKLQGKPPQVSLDYAVKMTSTFLKRRDEIFKTEWQSR